MIFRSVLVPVMLAALLACGCSSDANNNNNTPATFEEACAQVPGCQTPENAVDGPSVAIWQVMLQRDASGAASVGEVREVDVPSGTGVPQGPLWGAYRLVAYDAAGKVLDAQAIRFPERLVVETVDGTSEETDFTNKASSALGYLEVDASVAKIAITDADGNQLDARDAPAPGERRSASLAGVRRSAVLQATARTPCSHVLLLEQSDTALFTDAIVNEGYKLAPLPLSAQAVIQAALGRLTPLACAAVGRIAFVASDTTTTGAWVNGRFGDMMIINANFDVEGHTFDDAGLTNAVTRSILEGSVVHEAGHNVWRLLNMEGANNVAFADGWWTERQRGPARAAIARTRMLRGFGYEWRRVHDSFVAQGWAKPYATYPLARFSSATPSDEDLVRHGFMSIYGNLDDAEDIAELMRWPIFGAASRAAGLADGWGLLETADVGCVQMGAHGDKSVPQKLAVIYTKLAFMHDLGLISDQAFTRCAGSNISIPTPVNGFTVYESGSEKRRFDKSPSAIIGSRSDSYVFVMTAEGTASFDNADYAATVRLELQLQSFGLLEQLLGAPDVNLVAWPRGLYPLAAGSPNTFSLAMPDQPFGDFQSTKGWVLVTNATNELIVGSVYLEQAFRPRAGVPQTFDPPLQFRFRMKK